MSKDYYQTLGVSKTSTQDEIKKAFRKQAHLHHPDKSGGNAEKFKEINEAYQVLGNPEKRKKFDQFGSGFENAGAGGFGGFSGGPFNWQDFAGQGGQYGNVNFDMGDLGDIFGDFFGRAKRDGGGGRTRRQSKGADLETEITISFEESVFGTEKVLSLRKQSVCGYCRGNGAEHGTKIETCKTCGGSGQVTVLRQTFLGSFRSTEICSDCGGEGKKAEKECRECRGQGVVSKNEQIKVKIPAGIAGGETLKLSGQGEAGLKGSRSGDLFIRVRVLPSAEFKREGDNLHLKNKIQFSIAALGGKISVKTLDGEVVLKIPSGTPSGRQFIIKDKGVPKLRGRGRGDLIVEVIVEVPDNLNRAQKKLIEELAEEGL